MFLKGEKKIKKKHYKEKKDADMSATPSKKRFHQGGSSSSTPKKPKCYLSTAEKQEIFDFWINFITLKLHHLRRVEKKPGEKKTPHNNLYIVASYRARSQKFLGVSQTTWKDITRIGRSQGQFRDKGAPRTLDAESESLLAEHINKVVMEGHLLTRNAFKIWCLEVLRSSEKFKNADPEKKLRLVSKIGGNKWIRSFLDRHAIRLEENSSALELPRAQKTQPENILDFYRRLLSTHGAAQVHFEARRLLQSDVTLQGVRLDSDCEFPIPQSPAGKLPECTASSASAIIRQTPENSSWQPGLTEPTDMDFFSNSKQVFEIKGNSFYNSRLGIDLTPIRPECIWNLDEKPLMPDVVKGSCTLDGMRIPNTSGTRGASWSLLFWLSASGKTIPPLCILPDGLKSTSAEIALTIEQKEPLFRTAFEPNGYMNTRSFENELYEVLQLLRQTMMTHECGMLIFDNHASHVSRKASNICRYFGFHILTLPSHLSMTTQPLDNHFNLSFQRRYQKLYAHALSQPLTSSKQTSILDKVSCVIDAFRYVSDNDVQQNINSFKICGMPSGFPDPRTHLKAKRFPAGIAFRGANMPKVSSGYLKILFSPENLVSQPGYIIDKEILDKLATQLVSEEDARKSAEDLLNLLSSFDHEGAVMGLTLKKVGSYYFPNVQQKKQHLTCMIYISSISLHTLTRRFKLSLMVGAGMVMTCATARRTLLIIETVLERKKQAAADKENHSRDQKHLWLALLSKLIELQAVPATRELEKDSLPSKVLHSACVKLAPRVRKDGGKIVVANRLLERLGIQSTLKEYTASTPQVAAADNTTSHE